MSLDVYLTAPDRNESAPAKSSGIFIRDNGRTIEISRSEWDQRFPFRDPVVVETGYEDDPVRVYSANITHNLIKMADAAGIYECLWQPEEIGITKASDLVCPLQDGLALLQTEPERFRQFNPPNGWGTYEYLMQFVADYVSACRRFPNATVSVWR